MSEKPDQESKTEQASEKKIQDALEKGNIPVSREVVTLGSICAILCAIAIVLPQAISNVFILFRARFERVGSSDFFSTGDASRLLSDLLSDVWLIFAPVFILLALGGIVGSVFQNVPSFSLDHLAPKYERLSPKNNFTQIYGKAAWLEFAVTICKLIVALVILYWVSGRILAAIGQLSTSSPVVLLGMLSRNAILIASALTFFCLVVAVVDLIVVRGRWSKKLMMTRQEVSDEQKQSDGDPYVKQRMNTLSRQRQKRRMMAALPTATMVVVNPTHYAVAMRYVQSEGGAPKVVAKGMDILALRIKQTCEANKIPVLENPPLARSLYAAVDVGSTIPPEFYRAVAEVIHFVELRNKLSRTSSQP